MMSKKLVDIVKITSGSNFETAQFVDQLYSALFWRYFCAIRSPKRKSH